MVQNWKSDALTYIQRTLLGDMEQVRVSTRWGRGTSRELGRPWGRRGHQREQPGPSSHMLRLHQVLDNARVEDIDARSLESL